MTAFLTSIGYQHWVLPALLIIPLIGAALIWSRGAAVIREEIMRKIKMFLIVPAAILAVACGRDDSSKKVDDALNADLTLAAQARPYTAMDSISAMERAYAGIHLSEDGDGKAKRRGGAPCVREC